MIDTESLLKNCYLEFHNGVNVDPFSLRETFGTDIALFNPSIGENTKRFKAKKIFGDQIGKILYLPSKRQKVETFLEGKFFKNNPQPDKYLRSSFTKILHQHNLHWSGCHKTRAIFTTICSSLRYLDEVKELVKRLRLFDEYSKTSFVVPDIVPFPFSTVSLEKSINRQFYYRYIERSREVWVYNREHVGISTSMEIAWALAKGIPVSLLFPPVSEPIEFLSLLAGKEVGLLDLEDYLRAKTDISGKVVVS